MDTRTLNGWNDSQVHDSEAYPEVLRLAESEEVQSRRRAWAKTEDDSPAQRGPVGFALSGGGIRSATFSLGFFQSLARAGGLAKVDFLSTVSGGGYFGGFLGRMFHNKLESARAESSADAEPRAAEMCRVALSSRGSAELRWLRDNGRYLAPGGSGDLLAGATTVFRNWAAVLYLLAASGLAVLLLARIPLAFLPSWELDLTAALFTSQDYSVAWSAWLWAPLVLLVLGCLPFGWAYFLVYPRQVGGVAKYIPRLTPAAAVVSTVALLLAALALGPLQWLGDRGRIRAWLTAQELSSWPVDGLSALAWVVFAGCLGACLLWLYTACKFGFLARVDSPQPQLDVAHAWLGRSLTGVLTTVLALLLLAVLDSAGGTAYYWLTNKPALLWGALTTVVSVLGGLVGFGSRLAALVADGPGKRRVPLPWKVLATVGACIALGLLLVALDAVAHGLCWGFGPSQPPIAMARGVNEPCELQAVDCKQIRLVRVQLPVEEENPPHRTPWLATLAAAALFILTALLGQLVPFLNYSSLHDLYSARLTRAYLGASNPRRDPSSKDPRPPVPVLWDDPDDDLPMKDYRPTVAGGPVHIVNVTINETVSPKTGLTAGDQQGLGMAVSPNALSVGVRNHVVRRLPQRTEPSGLTAAGDRVLVRPKGADGPRVFEYPSGSVRAEAANAEADSVAYRGEPLTLGRWVAISGAAFSTGIGLRTSLGTSLLCGLANVRLGYWWNSGVDPRDRRKSTALGIGSAGARRFTDLLPVHCHLLEEWFAQFHGTNRRYWNLSDGGHFNNLGAYELVRRRLPLIVVIDAEADPDNTFDALTDLVRRIRVDFHAETRFLTRDEDDMKRLLDDAPAEWRHVIGELGDLARVSAKPVPAAWKGKATPQDLWVRTESEEAKRSKAHATLAEIVYLDRETSKPSGVSSLMLYVKASLTGDERADVLQYQRTHPDFPHETTADQFFDDAQWESYRKLGEHIGALLLKRPSHIAEKPDRLSDRLAQLGWLW